jgi:hypothetical protein
MSHWSILCLNKIYFSIETLKIIFLIVSDMMLKVLKAHDLTIIMRKRVEMMDRSTTAKNGHERIVTDRDNVKHLEYFMNGQWRHSDNCKDFTNKECTFKTVKSSLH